MKQNCKMPHAKISFKEYDGGNRTSQLCVFPACFHLSDVQGH